MREIRKWHFLTVGILSSLFWSGIVLGDDGTSPQPATSEPAGTTKPAAGSSTATPQPSNTEEAKLLSAVRDALERNAQEIKSLKEQYAKDMAEQRQKVEEQQKQIVSLQQSAQVLQDRLKSQVATPNAAGDQNAPGQDRQKQLSDLQQKEIGLLEQQAKMVADQLDQQAPLIDKLQGQTATLESRVQQAARRDLELASQDDALIERIDAQLRNGPQLPATLKGLFAPVQTTSSPLTVVNTFAVRYDLYSHQRGAGLFEFQEYSPFFLTQLNKRILLSAQATFAPAGVVLTQAQADIFINDWLTMDIGYFLAPIGFWNERLNPEWINKLPDQPVFMRQVVPDGLTLTGLQLRGAKYLFDSPVKMEYSAYAANGLGVPVGTGQPAWANLTREVASTSSLNNGMAYGGRFGFWLPTRGINFGVSEIVNAPYSTTSGSIISIWQPYFNYHYGNWDFRFEDGQNYERTTEFLGHSISRNGLYAQLAYRDYKSTRKHLQKLEYVFRFSDERFAGINQQGAASNLAQFATPMDAPVDRNQYTIGLNYYLFPVTVFKIAYEINEELHTNLRDNVLFLQFATNF
jgi:hypothetical protein